MGDYLQKNQVEKVPQPDDGDELLYYIPVFPIEQKGKVRIVFDSSAKYGGISLNDCLLQGPDDNNRIIGVLTRFRHGPVGYAADIERMFHSFLVSPEHRNLMRFYWWDHNNPDNKLVPYRSNVHVFGNKCSPAIATYGLRLTTLSVKDDATAEARERIHSSFYVDDLLAAAETAGDAVIVLRKCIEILGKHNLRLHKICSSSEEVLKEFPSSELAENVESISFEDSQSVRALGLKWCIQRDTFKFKISFPLNPFTKSGILSTVNRPYDPLGIIAPVILGGKMLQREIIQDSKKDKHDKIEWDEPLSELFLGKWKKLIKNASADVEISMPRSFYPAGFGEMLEYELHVFCDASEVAIGTVMYIKAINASGRVHISFLYGNSKLSPRSACSIPRNELCAALEASSCARYMSKEFEKPIKSEILFRQ